MPLLAFVEKERENEKKYVYLFSEGDASMRNLLGGKGRKPRGNDQTGSSIPQGFTITTEACTRYYDDDRQINADIQAQIDAAVLEMEKITGKSSVINKIRCLSPYGPAPEPPCPA